ncbi:TonB-dependent receptor plug [Chitinispirillum alkaliphilum]|nr:TonB-dependent receptor plug [Chitinispirillum alkaliphilum]
MKILLIYISIHFIFLHPPSKASDFSIQNNDLFCRVEIVKKKNSFVLSQPFNACRDHSFLTRDTGGNGSESETPAFEDEYLELDTFIVTGTRALGANAWNSVTNEEMKTRPGTFNDLNRIISSAPTVTTHGTIESSGLFVRGGEPRENLYLIDGIAFRSIDHFTINERGAGAIGFINTEIVSSATLHSGVTPASVRSNLSSVIDIQISEGTKGKPDYKAGVDLSGLGLVYSNATQCGNSSLVSSVRYSNLKFLDKITPLEAVPIFANALVKVNHLLNESNRFEFLGIGAYDKFLETQPSWLSSPRQSEFILDQKQYAAGLKWLHTNKYFDNELALSFSSYEKNAYFLRLWDHLGNEKRKSGEINRGSVYGLRTAGLTSISPNTSLGFGLNGNLNEHELVHLNYFFPPLDTTFYSADAGVFADLSADYKIYRLYSGVRLDYYSIINSLAFSPRVLLDAHSRIGKLSFQFEIKNQIPELVDIELQELIFASDGSQVDTESFSPQRCWAYEIGYHKTINTAHDFKAALYYKYYDREYPYMYPYERYYSWKSIEDYQNRVWEVIPSDPEGSKKAYGAEISYRNRASKLFTFTGSGSLSSVRNKYTNNKWYYDRNDVRYRLNTIITANLNQSNAVSAGFSLTGGRPYSQSSETPQEWFTKRFPPLPMLSLRYLYQSSSITGLQFYLDLTNLLNRKIPVYRELYGFNTYDRYSEGFIPMIGVSYSF